MDKKIVLVIAFLVVLSTVLIYVIIKGSYLSVTHDIAVVSVTPSETEIYAGNVVNITVVIKNEGSQTETFNVTAYYNTTVIETQTVTSLVANAQTNLTFSWNTTGIVPANYRIKAKASVVPGETDTSDNTYLNGIVRVRAKSVEPAALYVNPSMSMAGVGQNFTISINISDVVDLYGWEFKLKWNSTLLDAVNVIEGSFLKQGGNTLFITPTVNNTGGYLRLDCTLLGDIPGVSGNGTLATIEFTVKATGECALDLYDTALVSSFEQPITHTITDGHFNAIS